MCIIIDTNCFSSVFSRTSANHSEFKPVLNWIVCGHGKAVYGGSKYKEELKTAKHYLKIFRLLGTYNRLIKVDDNKVDAEQNRVEGIIIHPDFDDPHLAAIVIVSRCKLICSVDTRSIPHVTNRVLYNNQAIPKYYTGLRNSNLLCDKNIPKKYFPCTKNAPNVATRIIESL
jgi:hypothetical protein